MKESEIQAKLHSLQKKYGWAATALSYPSMKRRWWVRKDGKQVRA